MSYSCVHLFGVKCGLYCLSYVKSSAILAASILIPVINIPGCQDDSGICSQSITYTLSALMGIGVLLSSILNPRPLVKEHEDQFAKPTKSATFVSTHDKVEF